MPDFYAVPGRLYSNMEPPAGSHAAEKRGDPARKSGYPPSGGGEAETEREHGEFCSCSVCRDRVRPVEEPLERGTLIRFGAAGALLAAGILTGIFAPFSSAALVLLLAAALLGGYGILRTALFSLLRLRFTIDVLIGIAAAGAFLTGNPEEGATVLILYAIAELLEERASGRAQRSIAALVALAPQTAQVRREGREATVPVEAVRVGETVIVRPGDTVPLDGTVSLGASTVEQAPITGESYPVAKAAGDPVFAGTRNLEGYLEVLVAKRGEESTIARVLRLVAEAQRRRSPTEAFIERFSRVYTPAVILLAAALIAIPPLLFGVPILEAFYRALILLVIACPCALAISTPVSMVSGITTAARHGVLIKGRDYLEAIGEARVFVFDKTGTLTTGRLEVTDLLGFSGTPEADLLGIAGSLESRSAHPLAGAILQEVRRRGIPLRDVDAFRSISGRGIQGSIGGTTFLLGNASLFPASDGRTWEAACRRLEGEGKTVVLIGTDSTVLGLIALSDTIREAAAETIAYLRSRGIRTVMLTGDNERIGEAVSRRLGIDECHAGLLPEEKAARVERLMEQYGHVVMVGDGVNDAPALARATVGIAMGAIGSDVAIETADIVILKDQISRVGYLLDLSRRTMRVIRQNVAASILVKFGIAALAFPGLVTLWMAVAFGDMGLSLAVIGNALRIPRSA